MIRLKRRKRERMGVRAEAVIRCPGHLAWVRGYACIIHNWHGHHCNGRIEAHHVATPETSAKGRKVGDDQVIPVCAGGHEEGHRIGWESFDKRYGLKPEERITYARTLWRLSPHRPKYERKMADLGVAP